MTNPARKLHDLFTEWKRVGGAPLGARGHAAMDDEGIAEELLEAAGLVQGVDRCLDELKSRNRNVKTPERHFATWVYAVFTYPQSWQTQDISPLLGAHQLDVLDMLADTIDNELAIVNADALEGLRALFDEADELLRADETISEQMRSYIYKMLQELRRTVDDAVVLDTFDLREALTRLWVAFYGAAGQSTSEQSRWKDLADKLWFPAASGLLGSLPGVAISAIALTAGAS